MSNITAALVKELREKSGAGMMDCKKALQENNGDIDAAADWLRTKGLAKAAKKAGRVAAEGLVAIASTEDNKKAVLVEVNSETDFVARNETFQDLVKQISDLALTVDGDFDALKTTQVPGAGVAVEEHMTNMVATIGENMSVRRSSGLEVSNGVVASYIHNQVVPGQGKIGVLVALESTGKTDELDALGKQIAMHIAATNPLALDQDGVSADVVEKERAVLIEQAKESGKPDNIIEKMVEGRIRKFYEDVALLSQTFVVDGETRIEKVLKNAEGSVGAPVAIKQFLRFELGEGIEKKEDDFAAEVAAAAGV